MFKRLADFANYVIGDTFSPENEGLKGRVVAEIAAERGTEPFATLVDIVCADELRTILWPIPPDGDPASWELRRQIWDDPRVLLGGSDAGAHLDRMCGAPYPTRFLGDTLRGRKLVPLEKAVQLMTDVPARLFGLRDRGRIADGWHADLVVLDPGTVGAEHATLVHDLPGDSPRLTAESNGVVRVYVNGVETVRDGTATGALPGHLIRAGKDTDTVATGGTRTGRTTTGRTTTGRTTTGRDNRPRQPAERRSLNNPRRPAPAFHPSACPCGGRAISDRTARRARIRQKIPRRMYMNVHRG